MPRFRVAARLLRTRFSSSSAEFCASCASAAIASGSSSSLSPSSPSCSRSLTSWLNPSPHSLFWRSIPSCSSPSRQKEAEEETFGRPRRISSPARDAGSDLIIGAKQWQQVWLFGLTKSLPAPRSWVLHSFSAAYSNATASSFERDGPDHKLKQHLGISDLVSPSSQKREKEAEEEEEEEVVVVNWEGSYRRHDSTPAGPADNRLSSTFWQSKGEEEVNTQLDSGWTASTDENEESDISELELLDVDDVHSQSKDLDDDVQFEAEHSRPDEEGGVAQWADSRLEHMSQAAAAEKEEVASSEAFSDYLNLDPTTAEDAREMVLIESEPDGDQHQDGLPYLHTLSVDEIQEILEKARAKDVRILHVRKCCEWVDQLVFASGRSSRHLRGMADAIVYKVKQCSANVGPNSFPIVEGRDGEQWMAIDCGDSVVHLFLEEARSYYDLEEFWSTRSNQDL